MESCGEGDRYRSRLEEEKRIFTAIRHQKATFGSERAALRTTFQAFLGQNQIVDPGPRSYVVHVHRGSTTVLATRVRKRERRFLLPSESNGGEGDCRGRELRERLLEEEKKRKKRFLLPSESGVWQ